MSLYTTKDFADYVGVKPATLRKQISRKQVIKTGKFIDSDNPINQVYIQEHLKDQAFDDSNLASPDTGSSEKELPENIKETSGTSFLHSLTRREKIAKTLKMEREAEYKRMQNLKIQGKLMPIDLVETTLNINIQSIFRSFESASENIASIYNERLGGNRADLADMISRMRQELERAIESAKLKSREEIEAHIQEYAETRSRGEKK